MRIRFDKASSEITYPIDSATVKRSLQTIVPKSILARIEMVRFGCNRSTTQEARIVGRGSTYEIRINFCLVNHESRVLSDKSAWVRTVEECGGVIDAEASVVKWSGGAARKYALFLLMHEVGHAVYAEERGYEFLQCASSSRAEEDWCDAFARKALGQVRGLLGS